MPNLDLLAFRLGGVFASKHAALAYACSEAEYCPAKSVRIELTDRRPPLLGNAQEANDLPSSAATGT